MIVLSRWMQDRFCYCHSNPIFWEQLLDLPARQYHYGARGASPTDTGDFQLMLLYTMSWGAKDLSHAQEPTGNVRRSFKITWTFGYQSASELDIGSVSVLTNSKLQRIHFATHLSTSCWRSFGYGKLFMYMYSVFISLTIPDLHYLQGLVPDDCRRKLLSVLGEISNLDVIWYDQWMEESR